jgi:hypothetical protein
MEIGDKVVCININTIYLGENIYDEYAYGLSLNKIYICTYHKSFNYMKVDEFPQHIYLKKRFKKLVELREEKLLKLKEKICLNKVII